MMNITTTNAISRTAPTIPPKMASEKVIRDHLWNDFGANLNLPLYSLDEGIMPRQVKNPSLLYMYQHEMVLHFM